MKPFSPPSIAIASTFATLMSVRGMKRQSLTKGGAICAFFVGFLSLACGLRGFLLLLFYVVGTKATKYKMQQKAQLDSAAAESSCRGPSQVLACSIVGVIIQLVHVVCCGEEQSIDFATHPFASSLASALIAHHATNLADTLASELGVLSKRSDGPILITTGKRVPRGTNGGITSFGTGCSVLGGCLIGCGALLVDIISGLSVHPMSYISFGCTCGFIGSGIDSWLGATMQATYYDEEKKCIYSCNDFRNLPPNIRYISGRDILTNAQVNIVSILITSAIGFKIGSVYF